MKVGEILVVSSKSLERIPSVKVAVKVRTNPECAISRGASHSACGLDKLGLHLPGGLDPKSALQRVMRIRNPDYN